MAQHCPFVDARGSSYVLKVKERLRDRMGASPGATNAAWFGEPRSGSGRRQMVALEVVDTTGPTRQHKDVWSFAMNTDVKVNAVGSPNGHMIHAATLSVLVRSCLLASDAVPTAAAQ